MAGLRGIYERQAMTTEPLSARLERLAKDATSAEWEPGCFTDPSSGCQCSFILCDSLPGAVATIHYGRCLNAPIEDGGGYPTIGEARANAALIVELRNALETIIAALKEAGK
jgi:hypothetical protein